MEAEKNLQQPPDLVNSVSQQRVPSSPNSKHKLTILIAGIFGLLLIISALVIYFAFITKSETRGSKTVSKILQDKNKSGEIKTIIEGHSMHPKFKHGEEHVVHVFFTDKKIERGDVVLLNALSEKRTVKRVIGLPNEKIMVKGGHVVINGVPLEEPYLEPNTQTYAGAFLKEGVEVLIPDNKYAVMGDNRPSSVDSREWGFVEEKAIEALVK